MAAEGRVVGAALIPGMPHLLASDAPPSWSRLADAVRLTGDRALRAGAETLVVISTQWFTVLGHQFQADPAPTGRHVDENWYGYDYGRLDYRFDTDTELVKRWVAETADSGMQSRPVHYEGFPMDTGAIVADKLLNSQRRLRMAQVSCNLYADTDQIEVLGRTAAAAARALGRNIFAVAVTGLSSGLHQEWITPSEDRVTAGHDEWNRKVLDHLRSGDIAAVLSMRETYAREAQVDSQLRALGFLIGTGMVEGPAELLEYGPIWGTGAAVLNWLPRSV